MQERDLGCKRHEDVGGEDEVALNWLERPRPAVVEEVPDDERLLDPEVRPGQLLGPAQDPEERADTDDRRDPHRVPAGRCLERARQSLPQPGAGLDRLSGGAAPASIDLSSVRTPPHRSDPGPVRKQVS